jgi:hypothetical protein
MPTSQATHVPRRLTAEISNPKIQIPIPSQHLLPFLELGFLELGIS